ncbi:MAG TPA: ribbon-helix-helix protein, CopG family [Coriobacteriia bacterium]
MARTAVTIGFSVPPEMAAQVERMARNEGRSKSELFRDMVATYRETRELEAFEELASYGREQARSVGVRTEHDVERLIAEARSGA